MEDVLSKKMRIAENILGGMPAARGAFAVERSAEATEAP